MAIDLNDPQLESKLQAQEQLYQQLRATGEEAPAKILSLTDTGHRIGGDASLLEFYVEVFPDELPPFNTTTLQAVSDESLAKFSAGQTIFVKFDPQNPKQVAVNIIPVASPEQVVTCQFCGATQTQVEGQTACDYCRKPFMV